MIRLRVLELLEERGKTKYWMCEQMNMRYQNFNNMISNKTKSMKIENIEAMCTILDCSINDLFEYKKDR